MIGTICPVIWLSSTTFVHVIGQVMEDDHRHTSEMLAQIDEWISMVGSLQDVVGLVVDQGQLMSAMHSSNPVDDDASTDLRAVVSIYFWQSRVYCQPN